MRKEDREDGHAKAGDTKVTERPATARAVKSAGRAGSAILEMSDDIQRDARVAEIAERL